MKNDQKTMNWNEILLIVIMASLFVFFSVMSNHFLKFSNIMLLMTQMVELGLLTMAMSISIISGGMDLSIASQASLYTVLFAIFIGTMGLPSGIAMLIVLLVAVFVSAINGFLVGYIKVVPMLATMGMQLVFSGIGMLMTSGSAITITNPAFNFIGQYRIFDAVPIQLISFALIIFAVSIMLNKTTFGRKLYLMGTNANAARFTGVNVSLLTVFAYIMAGVLSYFAGMIFAARLSSGRSDVADSLLLQSIAASILGGINVKGGGGKVTGAMLGVAIFAIISNGLNMMRASSFLQQVLVGLIMLLVLSFKSLLNKN